MLADSTRSIVEMREIDDEDDFISESEDDIIDRVEITDFPPAKRTLP